METKILSGLTFYSGGAQGADKLWEDVLTKLGARFIVYRPYHIDKLSELERSNVNDNYMEVVNILHRKPLSIDSFTGKLVRRDMLQVKDASQVLALAPIDKNTGYVSGGTGYATTRAILLGIPVFVFDFNEHAWFYWNYSLGAFREVNFNPSSLHYYPPKLEDKSCLVGSRHLIPECKDQIINLIKNYIKDNGNN